MFLLIAISKYFRTVDTDNTVNEPAENSFARLSIASWNITGTEKLGQKQNTVQVAMPSSKEHRMIQANHYIGGWGGWKHGRNKTTLGTLTSLMIGYCRA